MIAHDVTLRCTMTGVVLAQINVQAQDSLPIRLRIHSGLWTLNEARRLLAELTEAIEIAEEVSALPAPLTPEQQEEYDRASGQG